MKITIYVDHLSDVAPGQLIHRAGETKEIKKARFTGRTSTRRRNGPTRGHNVIKTYQVDIELTNA